MSNGPTQDNLEAQVLAARARGEFDDLPGRGTPLRLDEFDHLPPEQRFEALLMRATGEVPLQVALVREIRAHREAIRQSTSESDRERSCLAIREKLAELQAVLKRSR